MIIRSPLLLFAVLVIGLSIATPGANATRKANCGQNGGVTGSKCPDGKPFVNCLVAPCSTKQCQDKCALLGDNTTVACQDDYCGSCGCTCCLKRNAGCRQDSDCCPGTICALSNACAVNLFAMCTTTCIPREEAASSCSKRDRRCNPDKLECCTNTLSCQRRFGRYYTCQTCKQLGERCDPGKRNQCCPYHKCTSAGGQFTCQQDPDA